MLSKSLPFIPLMLTVVLVWAVAVSSPMKSIAAIAKIIFFIIISFYVNLYAKVIKKKSLCKQNMRFNIYLTDVIRQGRKT